MSGQHREDGYCPRCGGMCILPAARRNSETIRQTSYAQPSPFTTRDPDSPQWEDCTVCGGDHWTLDHGPDDGPIE